MRWSECGRGNFAHTGEDGRHEMSEVMVMISTDRWTAICVYCASVEGYLVSLIVNENV